MLVRISCLWLCLSLWHLMAGVMGVQGAPAGGSPDPETQQKRRAELQALINADYKFRPTTWEDGLGNLRSNMKLEKILWSQRPQTFACTVFTQLTMDRLSMLSNQCRSYKGPISAAVYLSLVQRATDNVNEENLRKLEAAVQTVTDFFNKHEAEGNCQLYIMLFVETFDQHDTKMLYPLNHLRNYARLQARTKLVAMIDADLVLSQSLSEELAKPGRVEWYEKQTRENRVVVIPAMEPVMKDRDKGSRVSLAAIKVSKNLLRKQFYPQLVRQFKKVAYPKGHTPTNYKRWESADMPYVVEAAVNYEPWYIGHADVLPWYDVRFKGYGYNKIIQIYALRYAPKPFEFTVHPGAWLIHVPHETTKVAKTLRDESHKSNVIGLGRLPKDALFRTVKRFYDGAKRSMRRGSYRTQMDPAMLAMWDKLTWLSSWQAKPLRAAPWPEEVSTWNATGSEDAAAAAAGAGAGGSGGAAAEDDDDDDGGMRTVEEH